MAAEGLSPSSPPAPADARLASLTSLPFILWGTYTW